MSNPFSRFDPRDWHEGGITFHAQSVPATTLSKRKQPWPRIAVVSFIAWAGLAEAEGGSGSKVR